MDYDDFNKFAKKNKHKKCIVEVGFDDAPIEASIQRHGNRWYLCSDYEEFDGLGCLDKLGFQYSWAISCQDDLDEGEITNIKEAAPFISEDDF